ncbi:hypothetical protein IWX75_003381 [Arthrobacter sp. CAN_A6]
MDYPDRNPDADAPAAQFLSVGVHRLVPGPGWRTYRIVVLRRSDGLILRRYLIPAVLAGQRAADMQADLHTNTLADFLCTYYLEEEFQQPNNLW